MAGLGLASCELAQSVNDIRPVSSGGGPHLASALREDCIGEIIKIPLEAWNIAAFEPVIHGPFVNAESRRKLRDRFASGDNSFGEGALRGAKVCAWASLRFHWMLIKRGEC